MCRRLLAVLVAVAGLLLLGPAFAWAATPSPAPVPTDGALYAPGAWACDRTTTTGVTGSTGRDDCAVSSWSRVGPVPATPQRNYVNLSCGASASDTPTATIAPSPSPSPSPSASPPACRVLATVDPANYTPVLLIGGVLLLLASATFVIRYGTPWR